MLLGKYVVSETHSVHSLNAAMRPTKEANLAHAVLAISKKLLTMSIGVIR